MKIAVDGVLPMRANNYIKTNSSFRKADVILIWLQTRSLPLFHPKKNKTDDCFNANTSHLMSEYRHFSIS